MKNQAASAKIAGFDLSIVNAKSAPPASCAKTTFGTKNTESVPECHNPLGYGTGTSGTVTKSENPAPKERFLRLAEVQAMLGVSRSTIWRWHVERGLRVVRVGGMTRIRESDLQKFLARHEQGTDSAHLSGSFK